MEKNLLEAISDGVLAIIFTIVELKLRLPAGHGVEDFLVMGRCLSPTP